MAAKTKAELKDEREKLDQISADYDELLAITVELQRDLDKTDKAMAAVVEWNASMEDELETLKAENCELALDLYKTEGRLGDSRANVRYLLGDLEQLAGIKTATAATDNRGRADQGNYGHKISPVREAARSAARPGKGVASNQGHGDNINSA